MQIKNFFFLMIDHLYFMMNHFYPGGGEQSYPKSAHEL